MRHISFITLVLVGLGLAANAAWAGDISGQIHTKVKRYQRDVVVYIDTIPGKTFAPPTAHALMDQKNMAFHPHVLPITEGTTVDFLNSDDVLHNVFSPDKVADKINLGTWPKGQERHHTFTQTGAARLLCNVHPEMEAYIVVVPTPYFAKTDKSGAFKITGVPAGNYTLTVWNAKKNLKAAPQQVTVPKTGDVAVTITLK
jgi:plastocyanin